MKDAIKQYIKTQLGENPAWATRALVKIYERQTEDEKASGETHNLNGIGFNGVDAGILSSFATQVNAGRTLSPKQMAILFRKMPRYWKQVASLISPEKLAEIATKVAA